MLPIILTPAQGLAYYPTLLLNYRIKSSNGVSIDSISLSLMGFTAYLVSVCLQLFNPEVRSQFQLVYNTLPVISSSDLFYSMHGVFVILVIFSQCLWGAKLWGFKDRLKRRPHRITYIVFSFFCFFVLFDWFFQNSQYRLLNFVMDLAYFKVITSCIRYIPQVLQNKRRKSMYGSSKSQLLLDMIGCLFSVLEIGIKNDRPLAEALSLNRGKLGLIAISVLFDTTFVIQFWLYSSDDSLSHSIEMDSFKYRAK